MRLQKLSILAIKYLLTEAVLFIEVIHLFQEMHQFVNKCTDLSIKNANIHIIKMNIDNRRQTKHIDFLESISWPDQPTIESKIMGYFDTNPH